MANFNTRDRRHFINAQAKRTQNMNEIRVCLSVGALVLAALSMPAMAQPPPHAAMLLAQADAGKSRAAEAAVRAFGGKVLSVDKESSNGRVVYRVKLLQDGGRIRIVTIDGNTGKAV